MDKILTLIGIILFFLGALLMDSPSMAVPAIISTVGIILIALANLGRAFSEK